MDFDFDDAEKALRSAVRSFHGWTFEQFQSGIAEETKTVRGERAEYLLDVSVLDISGDHDAKDESLEIEFRVTELTPGARWRAAVGTETYLRRGETFSGEVTELYRVTAASARRAWWVMIGVVLAAVAVLLRCAVQAL